jgi:hypothetical protein
LARTDVRGERPVDHRYCAWTYDAVDLELDQRRITYSPAERLQRTLDR